MHSRVGFSHGCAPLLIESRMAGVAAAAAACSYDIPAVSRSDWSCRARIMRNTVGLDGAGFGIAHLPWLAFLKQSLPFISDNQGVLFAFARPVIPFARRCTVRSALCAARYH